MAGHAMVLKFDNVDVEEGQARISLSALFHDDVLLPAGEMIGFTFRVSFNATPNDIENAIEDAVLDAKSQYYPSMQLSRGDIVMYVLKRGQ